MLGFIIIAFVAGLIYRYVMRNDETSSNGGKPLPGPRDISYIANILRICLREYLAINEWALKYGPIFQVKLGSQRWVVISDAAVAHEIMVTRGSNYSARDQNNIASPYLHPGHRGISLASGDYFRKIRKFVHKALGQKPVQSYTPFIQKESNELMKSLYDTTLDPALRFRLFTLNNMFTVLYGRRFESNDDPTFLKLNNVIERTVGIAGLDAIVGIIPILSYLPIGVRSEAADLANTFYGLLGQFLDEFKEEEKQGKAKPCVAGYLKASLEEEGMDDSDMLQVFFDLFTAGTDTVSLTLSWMVAILASEPSIQERAHAELDAIVGRDRLPLLSDQSHLPYISAILRETTRFRPASGWLSFPHLSVHDDVYNGYHIPSGCHIFANVHAMNMDPRKYVNPEQFNPDRFVDVTEHTASLAHGPIANRDHVTFGWGRRICAGIHIAEAEGFLALAQLLWCYRFEVEEGGQTPVVNEWQSGFTMAPKPYKVKFVPRHENVKDVVFAK